MQRRNHRSALATLGCFLSTIMMLAVVSTVQAESDIVSDHYWTYQQFKKRYPEKQRNEEAFARQIRGPATPLSRQERPVRIAIIYPGVQASDYWRRSVSSFEARLREAGVKYEIRSYFSKPGKDIRLQENQIVNALQHDPDYLVYTLDVLKHRLLIERLIARKRPKVILQNITTPLKAWEDRQPFMYIGFDHASGTQILARQYLDSFQRKARYAIFYGPRGYVSQMRGNTFKNQMSEYPGMILHGEFYTGFDREKARKAALHILSQKQLDFIYACSTDIALGILDALEQSGKSAQVITNGWGGGDSELKAIESGKLEMTVMRMNDDNGVAMAEGILWDLRKKPVPTVYSGDMVLVTQQDSKSSIAQLRERAFRYSDHWVSSIERILRDTDSGK